MRFYPKNKGKYIKMYLPLPYNIIWMIVKMTII